MYSVKRRRRNLQLRQHQMHLIIRLRRHRRPLPTATPSFSSYKKVKDALTVTLPIFTTAEQAMGLSINVAQNELFTVSDIGSAFMIESRRFGHGVGMSQRGAEQMARQHGMTYEQILAFYYPGMGLAALNTEKAPLPTLDIELMATACSDAKSDAAPNADACNHRKPA